MLLFNLGKIATEEKNINKVYGNGLVGSIICQELLIKFKEGNLTWKTNHTVPEHTYLEIITCKLFWWWPVQLSLELTEKNVGAEHSTVIYLPKMGRFKKQVSDFHMNYPSKTPNSVSPACILFLTGNNKKNLLCVEMSLELKIKSPW